MLAASIGALCGAVISVAVGEPLVGGVLSAIGLALVDFTFALNPWWFLLAATWLTTANVSTDLRSLT